MEDGRKDGEIRTLKSFGFSEALIIASANFTAPAPPYMIWIVDKREEKRRYS